MNSPIRLLFVCVPLVSCGPVPDPGPVEASIVRVAGDYYRADVFDPRSPEEVLAVLPFKRIALSKGGCFGECPTFSVELMRSGEGRYVGEAYVDRAGEYETRVWAGGYALLCSLAGRVGMLDMQDRYAASWTDDETITITIEGEGFTKTIEDYGRQAPPEFQAFRALLEEVVEQHDWRPVEGQ